MAMHALLFPRKFALRLGRNEIATKTGCCSEVPKTFTRTPFWFLKFFFACYGSALALFIVTLVASLPFSGAELVGEHAGIIMLGYTVAIAPLVYRYLR